MAKYVVISETTPLIHSDTGQVWRYGDEADLEGRSPAVLRTLVERGIIALSNSDTAKKAVAAAEKARKQQEQEG